MTFKNHSSPWGSLAELILSKDRAETFHETIQNIKNPKVRDRMLVEVNRIIKLKRRLTSVPYPSLFKSTSFDIQLTKLRKRPQRQRSNSAINKVVDKDVINQDHLTQSSIAQSILVSKCNHQ